MIIGLLVYFIKMRRQTKKIDLRSLKRKLKKKDLKEVSLVCIETKPMGSPEKIHPYPIALQNSSIISYEN